MPKSEDPNRLVQARRKAGYGAVTWAAPGDFVLPDELRSICEEGDVIPMRFEECDAREDFEYAGEWPPTPAKSVPEPKEG